MYAARAGMPIVSTRRAIALSRIAGFALAMEVIEF